MNDSQINFCNLILQLVTVTLLLVSLAKHHENAETMRAKLRNIESGIAIITIQLDQDFVPADARKGPVRVLTSKD